MLAPATVGVVFTHERYMPMAEIVSKATSADRSAT